MNNKQPENMTYTSPGIEATESDFSSCQKMMDYLIMRQEAYDALKSLGKQRGFDITGDGTAVVPMSLNHLDGMEGVKSSTYTDDILFMKVPTIMRGIW